MFRKLLHFSLLAVACLSIGCDTSAERDSDAASPLAGTSPAQPLGCQKVIGLATPTPVELDILTYDEMQNRLADKRGKVVVMDAWSTACPPCMKEFHNLVELHNEHGPEELACVSLSFDYEGLGEPEEVREPVLGFLRSQGATFDNWMSSEESDVLYRKFDLNAVPAIFVYDRQGKLRQRFEAEGAYPQVRELVAELVKEPMPAGEEKGN